MSDWLAMRNIVLISDPRVTSIPVEENGEALADVRGVLGVDGRLADPAGAYAHLREGLLLRLSDAQRQLPYGYRLLVVEGYRPPVLQRRYFEQYKDELRAAFPEMSPQELHVAASRYVSPIEVAPHTAGAAVDLTLATDDGAELDMGTPVNANPEQSDGACYTDAPNISAAAREHRKILGAALESAGLVNYPTEWWHWSYGDRYWAMTTNTPAALYGPRTLT
ncbi:M15 family metallopeptidase [Sphaerisporangium sp. NPDC005289]|uniref:M15 family metallopeptidase n=1 Tax=Sphaerisporangium sp. NPDC005289 TaxID=3155247 RepID=UPI0033ADD6BC